MPYKYLDHIAIADTAFEATGATLEEMFTSAADATMNVMVADLDTIANQHQKTINLTNDALDMLLFQFLQEFVFYKDAEQLLLRPQTLQITHTPPTYTLTAQLSGQTINPQIHELVTDIKAVTLHRLKVEKIKSTWTATVVVDI